MNLYDNIKEDILGKIKNGAYPVGDDDSPPSSSSPSPTA